MPKTGVYPCYENQFKISTKGRVTEETGMVNIAECETFTVSVEGSLQEWTSYDQEGWTERLMTGKGLSISVTAKRCIGDAGNDYIAGLFMANGQECDSTFLWNFPSGAKLIVPCVVNVTNAGTGEATAVAPLEFEIKSHGKPTYTPAA